MTAHPSPFLSITEAREALTGNAAAVSTICPASPNTIIKKMTLNCMRAGMDKANTIFSLQCAGINTNTAETITALQCAGMDTSKMTGTLQTAKHTNCKDALAKAKDWCTAGCAERRSSVPHACGYHIGWGSTTACSPDCNGAYCDDYQDAEDDDDNNFTEQEYFKGRRKDD